VSKVNCFTDLTAIIFFFVVIEEINHDFMHFTLIAALTVINMQPY